MVFGLLYWENLVLSKSVSLSLRYERNMLNFQPAWAEQTNRKNGCFACSTLPHTKYSNPKIAMEKMNKQNDVVISLENHSIDLEGPGART